MKEFEAIVTGRVQLVMYRDFAQRHARSRDIKGSVENLKDGSVRVIAQGSEETLLPYIEDLKRGPLLSKVTNVAVSWREPKESLSGFRIIV